MTVIIGKKQNSDERAHNHKQRYRRRRRELPSSRPEWPPSSPGERLTLLPLSSLFPPFPLSPPSCPPSHLPPSATQLSHAVLTPDDANTNVTQLRMCRVRVRYHQPGPGADSYDAGGKLLNCFLDPSCNCVLCSCTNASGASDQAQLCGSISKVQRICQAWSWLPVVAATTFGKRESERVY